MSTNAQKGCGRGENKYVKEIHFLHRTLYQTTWEIRILRGTTSDVCWRRICFHCTEAFSVLEMFQDDTLYKLTYLLTYLVDA